METMSAGRATLFRLATLLVARAVPVRVYVLAGQDWFRYWMRRVAESRGA